MSGRTVRHPRGGRGVAVVAAPAPVPSPARRATTARPLLRVAPPRLAIPVASSDAPRRRGGSGRPVLAPIVGAQLTRVTSWRGVFVALALFGALLLVAAGLALRETLPPDRRRAG